MQANNVTQMKQSSGIKKCGCGNEHFLPTDSCFDCLKSEFENGAEPVHPLRRLRKSKKISQNKIAIIISAHPSTVATIERGGQRTPQRYLNLLVEHFSLNPVKYMTSERIFMRKNYMRVVYESILKKAAKRRK